MYYEDTFHPNEENDVLNHQKKELANVKSFDPGYGYIFVDKVLPSGKTKKIRVDCYSSGDSGTNIRNAETGDYYKYKVGSKEEDLFFKVALSCGKFKPKNGLNIIFYDGPEQYEKHLMIELDNHVKETWVDKKKNILLSNK